MCKLVKLRTERAELDGVRLLLLSDTHDFHDGMKYDLPAADILVHAGDFTVRGTREEVSDPYHACMLEHADGLAQVRSRARAALRAHF